MFHAFSSPSTVSSFATSTTSIAGFVLHAAVMTKVSVVVPMPMMNHHSMRAAIHAAGVAVLCFSVSGHNSILLFGTSVWRTRKARSGEIWLVSVILS